MVADDSEECVVLDTIRDGLGPTFGGRVAGLSGGDELALTAIHSSSALGDTGGETGGETITISDIVVGKPAENRFAGTSNTNRKTLEGDRVWLGKARRAGAVAWRGSVW